MTTDSKRKPHLFRCETCTTKEITDFDEIRCTKHNIVIGEKRSWLINYIGCASHSGAQQQAPAPSYDVQKVVSSFSCEECGDKKICNMEKCFHYTKSPNKSISKLLSDVAAQARKEGYAEGAAAERERVLKALIAVFEAFEDRKRFAYSADDIIEYIENFGKLESPRSQPEKQQEQFFPHRIANETEIRTTLPDFTKAKVGDWYQDVGEITTIYEENFIRRFGHLLLNQKEPECGACTGPDQMDAQTIIHELEEWKMSYLTDLSTGKDYVEIDIEKIDNVISELRQQGRS